MNRPDWHTCANCKFDDGHMVNFKFVSYPCTGDGWIIVDGEKILVEPLSKQLKNLTNDLKIEPDREKSRAIKQVLNMTECFTDDHSFCDTDKFEYTKPEKVVRCPILIGSGNELYNLYLSEKLSVNLGSKMSILEKTFFNKHVEKNCFIFGNQKKAVLVFNLAKNLPQKKTEIFFGRELKDALLVTTKKQIKFEKKWQWIIWINPQHCTPAQWFGELFLQIKDSFGKIKMIIASEVPPDDLTKCITENNDHAASILNYFESMKPEELKSAALPIAENFNEIRKNTNMYMRK